MMRLRGKTVNYPEWFLQDLEIYENNNKTCR